MFKRIVTFVFIPIFVFMCIIVKPVSVYAETAGYSWEDYTDDSAFNSLTAKEKILVSIDQIASGTDYLEWATNNSDSALAATTSAVVWVVGTATGIIDKVSLGATGVSAVVSLIANLSDNHDIVVDSSGNITLSSVAVDTIRQFYVNQYHIVTIDDYNTFSFGTVFNTDAVYSDAETVYNENIDMYAYLWNGFSSGTLANEFVVVPQVYYNNELYYGCEYAASSLKFYVTKNWNTTGHWHIMQYCDGSMGEDSECGWLYYDADILEANAEIVDRYSLTNFAIASIYFVQDDYVNSDSLPYSARTDRIYYDESTGYFYWSENNLDVGIYDMVFINCLLAFGSFDSDTGLYSPADASVSVLSVPYVSYMDSAFLDGDEQNTAKIVQFPMDSVLEDDITGEIYDYNTDSDYVVSDDFIDDVTDNDGGNSPTIIISPETIVNVINNYDYIINEVADDSTVSNVTNVINNYTTDVTYIYDDDDSGSGSSDSDDGSGSGSSGSDDGSDDGTILSWLEKIYDKLCEFYSDAMTYFSSIRSGIITLNAYVYVMMDDLSTLVSSVAELPNYSTVLSNIYSYVVSIRSIATNLNENVIDIGYYFILFYDDFLLFYDDLSSDFSILLGRVADVSDYLNESNYYLYEFYDRFCYEYSFIEIWWNDLLSDLDILEEMNGNIYNSYSRLGTANNCLSSISGYLSGIYEYLETIVYYMSYDSFGYGWLSDISSMLAVGNSGFWSDGVLYYIKYNFDNLSNVIASSVSVTDYSGILESIYNELACNVRRRTAEGAGLLRLLCGF